MSVSCSSKHKWTFAARFRHGAFGWRSSRLAVQRVKAAVAEIKAAGRKDATLAAEGAVLLFEKVSPALEQVDSSSGALGTAVYRAIVELVPVIAAAPADAELRDAWLERLWQAHMDDDIPYIELLGDFWGSLCASPVIASAWADRLVEPVATAWGQRKHFSKGTSACLSSLLAAGRYQELLGLLEKSHVPIWHYREFGVRALCAMGKPEEALRYAEDSRGINDNPCSIARACEEILLSVGRVDDAYDGYSFDANLVSTHLATFRAIVAKYPHKTPAVILSDLATRTRGEEGKWFAAAKEFGLFSEAIELAQRSPCDPRTLTRAARDFAESNPGFALEAGLTALHWLAEGYGYEITGGDVLDAYSRTMAAAANARRSDEAMTLICRFVEGDGPGRKFVAQILQRFTQ